MSAARLAEQAYSLTDVSRLLRVPVARLRLLQATGEFPPPDFFVPGGGRKCERWIASTVTGATERWSPIPAILR